jgi:ribonuclease Z
MKKHHIAVAAVAIVVALAFIAAPVTSGLLRLRLVQRTLIDHGFDSAMRANRTVAALVNAPELRVILCGTGSPLPNPERAGPCAAVTAAGKIWLIDAGGGGWRNLMLWHLPVNQLAGILVTHFHSDHIEDLGATNLQSWIAGRATPLTVYGGPGVDTVVNGFNMAYSLDTGYRVTHHGAAAMPPAAEIMQAQPVVNGAGVALLEGQMQTVLDRDGLKITAIGVNHAPVSPAYAYRFDYGGRSAVISGDTKFSPKFAAAITGIDVLVHEAQADEAVTQLRDLMAAHRNARLAKMLNDILAYHTTPAQAAEVANQAGARLLVLTHLTPALPAVLLNPLFMQDVQSRRASFSMVGYDGLTISLPPHATSIDISHLN